MIADMMLEGIMCEHCGIIIDTEGGQGYPGLCEDCQAEEDKKEIDRENAEVVINL